MINELHIESQRIKRHKNFGVCQRLIMMAIVAILTGCTLPVIGGYGAKGQSREEFEHYVEEVFRLQNRMTSEVMMLLENDDIKNPENLLLAEQRMQQKCDSLNEYVSREIDGLNEGLFLRRRVEQSALDCERAAREVEALLGHL